MSIMAHLRADAAHALRLDHVARVTMVPVNNVHDAYAIVRPSLLTSADW